MTRRLTDKEVKEIVKSSASKVIPYSSRGISVNAGRFVKRSGKDVVIRYRSAGHTVSVRANASLTERPSNQDKVVC